MNIDGTTRTIGLIGNPVEHTLSPLIHNGISEKMKQASVYLPFRVEEEGLGRAVQGAYELGILGLNVTVPHKNGVMAYLTELDEAAARIGAVNTLVRTGQGYKGYNTDWLGLRRQIHEDGVSLRDQTVVVFGAGGAAKAVVYLCLSEGAHKIYVLNRTRARAEQLAESMKAVCCYTEKGAADNGQTGADKGQRVIPMALADYGQITEQELIVFQATSIGLAPNVNEVVLEDAAFYSRVRTGIDLIYNPACTRFMQMVSEYGGKAYNARKMLLYQGVIAYELWHSVKVPQDVIDDIDTQLKRKLYPKDNIVLIGFMGSGKTTVGKLLAEILGRDFLDTDACIEQMANKTISAIFAEEGEEAFRRLETCVLEKLQDTVSGTILATGGGMPIRRENARLLREIGTVYYLKAANQVIYDRIKENTDRPLLQDVDPYGKICELMRQREPLYDAAADKNIDTNSNDLSDVVNQILQLEGKGKSSNRILEV